MAIALPVAVALTAAASCRTASPTTRLVLITLDTLRYDSFRGSAERPSGMPRLNERASAGAIFDRCFASTSSTQPTHASILTGLHPWQHGVTRNGLELGTDLETVPEILRERGFSTSAVVASLPLSARFGFGQGFDRFDESFRQGEVPIAWDAPDAEDRYFRLANAVTATAIAELDRADGPRQFFWFHYFDPHAPYGDLAGLPALQPRPILDAAVRGEDVRADVVRAHELYDADVGRLDASLDTLFDRLDRDRNRYATHVLVTSDHGESFGEDGSLGHGRRLTEPQIRVPCVILSPRLEAGGRMDVVGSVDLGQTLLALAGVDRRLPEGRDLTARAIAEAGVFGMRRDFRTTFDDPRLDGVHTLDFNLFYAVDRDGRLYSGNGTGMRDAPAGYPAPPDGVAQHLRVAFGAFEKRLGGVVRTERLDAATEAALRALGYVR